MFVKDHEKLAEEAVVLYEKAQKDEIIWRWGIQPEKLKSLRESCQEAHQIIGIHGVTAFAGETPTDLKISSATVENLADLGFPVYVTPLNSTPEHRTVELPKNITDETVRIWNQAWRRTKKL